MTTSNDVTEDDQLHSESKNRSGGYCPSSTTTASPVKMKLILIPFTKHSPTFPVNLLGDRTLQDILPKINF